MLKWLVFTANIGALGCVALIVANQRNIDEWEWAMFLVFMLAASSSLMFGYIHSERERESLVGLWIELQKKKIKKQLEDL